MKGQFLSIIVPTFNSEDDIGRCLTSIVRQTYTNWEVLVIDGASRDLTASIVRDFQEKHQRIRFLSEEDSGIYHAMNKGIGMAVGNWLYFLGSDDCLYNEFVLERIFAGDNLACDIIYGDVMLQTKSVYGGEFNQATLLYKNICHQAIFYRRKVFEIVGVFDTRFAMLADWNHNFRWFYNARIRKSYVKLIVAEYAMTGLSSVRKDHHFLDRRYLQFLRYNTNLSLGARYYYFTRHLKEALVRRKFVIFFEAFLLLPRLLLRLS